MGRLRNLSASVPGLAPRLRTGTDTEGHSKGGEPWRKWYSLKRWRTLRWATLVRDAFTCQMQGCGRLEPDTSLLVADHIRRHFGDPDLFWEPDNLQTLCKPCHDAKKQREERAAWGRGGSNL